jgi:hypothetical protein
MYHLDNKKNNNQILRHAIYVNCVLTAANAFHVVNHVKRAQLFKAYLFIINTVEIVYFILLTILAK